MDQEKLIRFTRLGTGGDVYAWIAQMRNHFQTSGMWAHVETGAAIEDGDDDDVVTPEMKAARCRRDILMSLQDDVAVTVRHLDTANGMFQRVLKIFVGTPASQRRKLRLLIAEMTFQGNYFFFLSKFESAVSQLDALDGVHSFIDVALMFLSKLPKALAPSTYPLKQQAEAAEEDNIAVWTTVYDATLDYLIDCGLYDASAKQLEKTSAMSAESKIPKEKSGKNRKKKKKTGTCWNCGKSGHWRSDCKDSKKKNQKKTDVEKASDNDQSWVCAVACTEAEGSGFFILDSGASRHICGDLSLFTEIEDSNEGTCVVTANGPVTATHRGTVSLVLDNELTVRLEDVLYWKSAPNLISVRRLVARSVTVEFSTGSAMIKNRSGKLLYKCEEHGQVFKVRFQDRPDVANVATSADVWHQRLNHCGKKRLVNTVGGLLPKDQREVSSESCTGCVQGKAHRSKITKKDPTPREALEVLVADFVGPYTESVDRKRRALIVTDAGSGFVWGFPCRKKSEVANLTIALLRRLDRAFPGKVKVFRTDNGREFCNEVLDSFLRGAGIAHQTTVPYVHEMNGRAENSNRIILESTRALLRQAGMTNGFWTFAMKAAIFVHNLIVPARGGKAPWCFLYGENVPLDKIRIFGVPGFAHISTEVRKKLDPTSQEVIFLGYPDDGIGFLVMDKQTRRIFTCRTFFCDESKFVDAREKSLGATGEIVEDSEDFERSNDSDSDSDIESETAAVRLNQRSVDNGHLRSRASPRSSRDGHNGHSHGHIGHTGGDTMAISDIRDGHIGQSEGRTDQSRQSILDIEVDTQPEVRADVNDGHDGSAADANDSPEGNSSTRTREEVLASLRSHVRAPERLGFESEAGECATRIRRFALKAELRKKVKSGGKGYRSYKGP